MLLHCLLHKLLLAEKSAMITSANFYFNVLYRRHLSSSKAAYLAKKEFDSLLKSAHTKHKDTFLTLYQKKYILSLQE